MVLHELGGKITGALRKLKLKSSVDQEVLDEVITEICDALLEADVARNLVLDLKIKVRSAVNIEDLASGMNPHRVVQTAVIEQLTELMDPGVEPVKLRKGRTQVVMFVGLQGSGKTTTCAKYANYYMKQKWKVAVVCADTFRAGAFDQVKQNCTAIHCPFYGSYTEADPVKIASEGVDMFRRENYELIIVDTSGRHKQETALFNEMQEIYNAVRPDETVFVMDALIGQAAYTQAIAFKDAVPVGSVIMTKMDGGSKGGGAISAVAATKAPIIFFGDGEGFDSLEEFNVHSFISSLLGYGNPEALKRVLLNANIDEEQTKQMITTLTRGEFTLRDMRQQWSMLDQLGPMSKIAEMLPVGPLQDMFGNEQMKRRMLAMLNAMSDIELDNPQIFKTERRRIRRVAIGSGSRDEDVEALLINYKQVEPFFKNMGKSGLGDVMNMMQSGGRVDQGMMMNMMNQMMSGKGMKGMKGAQMNQMQNMMRQMMAGGGIPAGMKGMPGMGNIGNLMNMMK
ncbi:hypothetical protein PCE1_003974 [Barthelona sp. PCE]